MNKDRAPLIEPKPPDVNPAQMFIPGHLAAHRTNSLVLLPSGSDTVQSVPLRKTRNSSHSNMDCSDDQILIKGIKPRYSGLRVTRNR